MDMLTEPARAPIGAAASIARMVNKTLNNALPVVHTLKKSNLLNSRKIIARFV